MQIQLISQSFLENRTEFKHETATSRWDQLFMIADGSCSFSMEGTDATHIVQKHEILFIPSKTTMHRKILAPATLYRVSFIAPADHPFRLALRMGKLTLPSAQAASIFSSMKRAILMPNNQELLEHMIEHILTEHYLFCRTDHIHSRPLSEEVMDTMSYMHRHLHEKLDIDELAARVYLSHTGLIWKFRQELNTTPSKYLILLRLRYAKQLLLDHDYTVTEIAEMCGYASPYYFTNAFRDFTGMSPTEFRRLHLNDVT